MSKIMPSNLTTTSNHRPAGMSEATLPTLVFNYQQTGKYALNVIAGCVLRHRELRNIPVHFAKNIKQLIETINNYSAQPSDSPAIVCWSFYSPQFTRVVKELAWVKSQTRKSKVIHLAGGVHATAEPEQTLKAGFDLVAVGEGEQIISDLLIRAVKGQKLTETRGIAHLDKQAFFKNGKGETVDINNYPPFASRYRKFGPLEITRGCIYACKFCQTPYVNKAKFRHRTLANIKHYVRIMAANGLRDYRFLTPTSFSYGSQDESVNINAIEEMLASVRKIVGNHRRIFYGTFPSEIRPEHVTMQNLKILKKYVDNDNIIIGGQSGSQTVLDSSRRGHDVSSIVEAVKISVKAGFKPNVDFLFGLPGETPIDAHKTLKLAEQLTGLGAKIHNHTFMPLPGTPFRNEQAGYIDDQTQQQIIQMTSEGKAYGKWKGQIKIARELEQLKSK